MRWDAAMTGPGTHPASQAELGLKWPGRCGDVGSAFWGRMVALGLVPAEPRLQHGQFGPGSVVLLVPRRWQQTPTPKPSTWGQKSGMSGASTPPAPPWFWVLCLQSLHPGLHAMDQKPSVEQEQAIGRLTTPAGKNSCRGCGHQCGDNPKRGFSHGCTLAALVPQVLPLHQSSVGRGSCLVSILNPASVQDGHNVLLFPFPSQFLSD